MSTKRFDYLFNLYINQRISPEQERELMAILIDAENENIIKERIGLLYDEDSLQKSLSQNKIDQILNHILSSKSETKRLGFRKIIAVAASVILGLLAGFLFYQNKQNTSDLQADSQVKEIMAPTKTKAFIILSNGESIPVEKINANNTINTDGVQIVKNANGDIEYKGVSNSVQFNMLENPAGSPTINLKLGDGTTVSLNSGSKITYPVSFPNGERKVDIIGEALFDVAHNAQSPFIVRNGKAYIKVLGTTFNVKGYSENKAVEVTLLKGKVQVSDSKTQRSEILSPGQKAIIGQSLDVVGVSDVENAIAWKNETFAFDNQPIEEIAQTLSRWYNVELEFKNNKQPESFSGIISRKNSLNETVKMLNAAGVKVQLSENKIIF